MKVFLCTVERASAPTNSGGDAIVCECDVVDIKIAGCGTGGGVSEKEWKKSSNTPVEISGSSRAGRVECLVALLPCCLSQSLEPKARIMYVAGRLLPPQIAPSFGPSSSFVPFSLLPHRSCHSSSSLLPFFPILPCSSNALASGPSFGLRAGCRECPFALSW